MKDLIDRQAAIDLMLAALDDDWEPDYAKDRMCELPSTHPDMVTVNIDHELTQEEYEKLRKVIANSPIMLLPYEQHVRQDEPESDDVDWYINEDRDDIVE